MVIHTGLIWHLFGWNWTFCWSFNFANGLRLSQRVSTPRLSFFCIDYLLKRLWFVTETSFYVMSWMSMWCCCIMEALMQNICSLCLHLGPRVKDVELLPDLWCSDSQPNLAVEQFPNMSIGLCVCVCVWSCFQWCGLLSSSLIWPVWSSTEQSFTKNFKEHVQIGNNLLKSFWGVFILQYHAIFMLSIMQKNWFSLLQSGVSFIVSTADFVDFNEIHQCIAIIVCQCCF